jgi:hypothetical protein
MLEKIESLTRHVMNNRRTQRRRRVQHDAVVRDPANQIIFRGRTKNISEGGVKIHGLPVGNGLEPGQRVRVEFLVVPKDAGQITRRPTCAGYILRVEDTDGDCSIAVVFDQPYEE